MKTSSFIVIVLTLLIPGTTLGLTLEEMQLAAVRNRALVKQYQADVERSLETTRIARSDYYPSVDVGYRSWSLDEASLTEQRQNSAFSASVSVNLFAGFAHRYALLSAEYGEQVENARLRAAVQDIQLAVALGYLTLYNQQARLKVARDNFSTLETLYLDSKVRFEVGLLDKNEVLKFRVDYDNARLAVQREEANRRKAVNDLSRVTGLELDDAAFSYEDFRSLPSLGAPETYARKMEAGRSELIALERLVSAAEARARAQQSGYYPRVDLGGSYRTYEDDYLSGQGDATDDELRAELTLSMNLFNGFADEATIARTRAETRSLRYQLAELQEQFSTELKNLFVDYQISLANVEVARQDIASAEENLRITRLKYQEGLQRQLDLLDAVANLTRAQSNYVAVVRTVFENYFQVVRMIEAFPARVPGTS